MLKFDILPLLKFKGERTPALYLKKNGFSKTTSYHFTGKKSVKRLTITDIRRLCNLFNCTPNDLFTYVESESKPLPANSPMKQLVRKPIPSIPELIGDLSPAQTNELMNKIMEMKNQNDA
jgi:DNA-binding Xre family transcriptional regulator